MTTILNKIRTHLLSPDSPFELFLRTLYHKVLSSRLYFHWQDYLAKRSYQKFRAHRISLGSRALKPGSPQPKITFILSSAHGQSTELSSTLNSIINLQGENWEVIFFSPGDQTHQLKEKFSDKRINFTENDPVNFLNHICGDYVIFCEAGDVFDNFLLVFFYQTPSKASHADLTYYDCEYSDDASGALKPLFKPNVYSPALLLSVNYLSRAFIKFSALKKVWKDIDFEADLESQIIFKLCENDSSVCHIPNILLMQKRLVTSQMPEIQKAIHDHLTQQGLEGINHEVSEIGVRFTWETHSPSLAIVILTKNNQKFLQPLIPALLKQPYNGELSLHIVDNGSTDLATLAYYKQFADEPQIAIISYPEAFNYSRAINLGVESSRSDLVLLMNDDMAIDNETWLQELVQWAILPNAGVIGAKLIRKNRTIQHAGIVIGLTDFVGHIYLNAPEQYHGMFGSVNWYRNYLAITGACQMVRRDVFDEVGGYDEDFRLAFGDIDFCLKVHQKGYQNIYTPFAQLYHYEGSTRGYQTPVQDALKGYEEFHTYLINEDPYFSENLTYTRIPKCVLNKRTAEERKRKMDARKGFYLKSK